tara:strand:+ start:865 stop:2664 length:1800 start_codon:yes stop_codon:yes gene_type:complete
MSVLDKLTEGIVNRDLQKEGAALLNKWEKTGLLEGLGNDSQKNGMARLLENQAKELLREASAMNTGDVEGFAAVAFPIVRRVFGGLIANDLVSVQPMSLPSGLIFFLDFEHNLTSKGGLALTTESEDVSLYGGGRLGQQITGGVDLTGVNAELGPYALNNGYASPTSSLTAIAATLVASGTFGGANINNGDAYVGDSTAGPATQAGFDKLCQFDPDFTSGTTSVGVYSIPVSTMTNLNKDNLQSIVLYGGDNGATALTGISGSFRQVRRLSQFSGSAKENVLVYFASDASSDEPSDMGAGMATLHAQYQLEDDFAGTPTAGASAAIGAVVGEDPWGLENDEGIPEIDIKVDSISVTAMTKKLKAKWTPELGQDLNAYHNLDAEVELTSILSEQIALEIDREILQDLVKGSTADTLYWSRRPGKFLDRRTGLPIGAGLSNESLLGADFTGNVSEWYETLIETINDVSAQIHRKTLRGGANFLVCSPEVANILEFTAGFRANVTADADRGTVGAVNVGSLSKKFDVYVDPYFPRNVILVGRKGASFLESGYVYAPYVPLQVTPTIFGVEDFVPRKGVMTRYAKKMVRPDMYGLVICADLNG